MLCMLFIDHHREIPPELLQTIFYLNGAHRCLELFF